ncbi:glycosyltransferase involved in cell wall biosynthesis [Granulicella aggregans]|uniref:Glycosyltransferase involved in cell wall biosynthesis n=2 Tax=Granulicella aggregans TaxID=474949 RepID=A0A7W7ZCJ9_9BACT|nr:glycosyltransferase involved in cell wall biosynthesis [Granulicella aggregans]
MSSDETAEIASRFPCTFLQRKDSGPAQAINRGLEMATGDIICWLNADDAFWDPTTLERVVRSFTDLPEVDAITGNGYYIDNHGRFVSPIIASRPDRLSLRWLTRHDTVLQPATFWRRNQFRLDETLRFCFDWKLWIDFFQDGKNILYVAEYFALYRLQPESLTYQDSASRRHEIYGMIKIFSKRRPQIAWCWFIWRAYQLSELLNAPTLKAAARGANEIMKLMSGDRISST